ncbi:MAG: hypothetical protein KQ78_01325 [Candidatus Izimaplasma bacterium HR2]|nr:MAG: hypothetical protein KQ78_01325 [Candidatus Izimaplasma bacterium HR2]
MNLIVTGNGFDLYHGLPTNYSDFRKFLFECGLTEAVDFEEVFSDITLDKTKLWANFENGLANINLGKLAALVSENVQGYEEEFAGFDYIDYERVNHYFNHIVDDELFRIFDVLITHLRNWIYEVNLLSKNQIGSFLEKSIFVSFNYTNTLEKSFGVEDKDLIHIHGTQSDNELFIGHGEKMTSIDNGEQIPYVYFNKEFQLTLSEKDLEFLEKDVYKHCLKLDTFIDLYQDVQNIYVLGHSLSSVDDYYFQYFLDNVHDTVNWYFSYFNTSDIDKIHKFCSKHNIEEYQLNTMDYYFDDLIKYK